jgi:diguanylate cyclase (GGDEF)-like protein
MTFQQAKSSPKHAERPEMGPPRSVLPSMMVVLLICAAAIVVLVWHANQEIDSIARDELKKRVAVALEIEAQRLQDLAVEYTYWDIAYQNLISNPNRDWADHNIGAYMHEYYDVAISLAADRSDKVTLGYVDGEEAPVPLRALLDQGADSALALARGSKEPTQAFSLLVQLGDVPYLVSLNTFSAESQEGSGPPLDGSFLLIGKRVDEAEIRRLAETHRVPGLSLTASGGPLEGNMLPLTTQDGAELIRLTWDDPAIEASVGPKLYVMIAIVFVMMALSLLWIFQQDKRERDRYMAILHKLAHHDELTGASNRRDFIEKATRELAHAARSGYPLGVLMLDIDFFKSVNDRWGHAAGDRVLAELSHLVSRNLRSFDLFARMGGEEFAILLPEIGLSGAKEVAERLRKEIKAMPIALDSGQEIRITVSLGAAALGADDDLDSLLARADRGLYAAKESGRDRCIAYEPAPSPGEG